MISSISLDSKEIIAHGLFHHTVAHFLIAVNLSSIISFTRFCGVTEKKMTLLADALPLAHSIVRLIPSAMFDPTPIKSVHPLKEQETFSTNDSSNYPLSVDCRISISLSPDRLPINPILIRERSIGRLRFTCLGPSSIPSSVSGSVRGLLRGFPCRKNLPDVNAARV
jgi:hypothetical protein